MIDDKADEPPKVLLAAGGERGVIRVLDINRKTQHTAVSCNRCGCFSGDQRAFHII